MHVPDDQIRLLMRCIADGSARGLMLEQDRTQRSVKPPRITPRPAVAGDAGEQHIAVALQHLHRDAVRLRSAELHTAVIRMADQHLREVQVQILQEHLRFLQLGAGAIKVRVAVVEAQGMVVRLITKGHHGIGAESSADMQQELKRVRVVVRCVQVGDDHDAMAHGRELQTCRNVVVGLRLDELDVFLDLANSLGAVALVVHDDLPPVPNQLAGDLAAVESVVGISGHAVVGVIGENLDVFRDLELLHEGTGEGDRLGHSG